jgi:biofilm PGA synthesis N-glycosyltransferase PgaC
VEKETRENQVFSDPSGRRWRWVQFVIALIIATAAMFLIFTLPLTFSNPTLPLFQAQASASPPEQHVLDPKTFSTEQLAYSLRQQHTPVIGDGPLIRVVKIIQLQNGAFAVDPFTGAPTKRLNTSDLAAVGESQYAIERYGATNGKHIALTFDDGPDPQYSGQVLDALSRHSIPASFFVLGENVVKYEDIARRMVREGHVIANHSFTHANYLRLEGAMIRQETIQTRRIIRAATSHDTAFFRFPYVSSNDQGMRDYIWPILEVQKLGYTITSYNFDTRDWDVSKNNDIPLPDLESGEDFVMLMHDSGGDRSFTVEYISKLVASANKHGYTFVNLNQLYPQEEQLFVPAQVSVEDEVTYTAARAVMIWPRELVRKLFAMTVAALVLSLVINTTLALLQKRKSRFKRIPKSYRPYVSVLVPAYNESTVITKTVRSILNSSYKNLEIIIIDDGSTDDTWEVSRSLALANHRVHCITQPNGGKSAALNLGVSQAIGEIVICVDADTVFPSSTVGRLVRHFQDPSVGAVAGSVKVGNIRNMLTRWQALEYTINIHLERSAHAYLGAIMIVPGACGAWRKEAVIEAGGYSRGTLAEDCDLTLSIHEAGYRVVQDTDAVGLTETPQSVSALAKQRFRWIFGNMQSYWKHRNIALDNRCGWLGMFVLPYAMFNTLLPIVFIPLLTALAFANIASGLYLVVLAYMGLVLVIQFIAAFIGVILARERLSLLTAVPLTRFIYSPLKTYLLYKSLATILLGAHVGWNKLKRTGTVNYVASPEPNVQVLPR